MSQKPQSDVHQQVSETYAKAVAGASTSSGCCSGKKEVVTSTCLEAGYDPSATGQLPEEAVTYSFGCGDPVAFSQVKEGEVVLDLGCGGGIDLLLASQKVGPSGKVIGVDMTEEMLELARRNVAEAGVENVEVRQGIIEALPVEDASVDLVISNCVINLSPDKPKVFQEIARVLKPGGRFAISDIVLNEDPLPDWILNHPVFYGACVSGAIRESRYLQGLADHGLTEVQVAGRQHYDREQLLHFAKSDLLEGADKLTAEDVQKAAEILEGRIWSARITGRKQA
ncbi:MAG: methyltransferase domain-containing protein [Planctomycetota bacterium]|nr:MAG: methyltransferase domain-containing protein [Planctomycetota bacterium]